jgi:hypothetical protein
MSYIVKDEDGEVMRIAHRKEEALCMVALRPGWTITHVRKPVRVVDLSQFEDALI